MPTEEEILRELEERERLEELESQAGPASQVDGDGLPTRKTRELFPVRGGWKNPAGREPGTGIRTEKPPLGTPPTADELAAAAMAPMSAALDRAGVTDELIARTILDGLGARRVVTATHEGKITDAATFDDSKLRLEAAALAAKLKGHMVDRQIRDVRQQSIIYIGGIDRTDPGSPAGPVVDVKPEPEP